MTKPIQIIGRGWNGWHAHGAGFTLTGGTLLPQPWWTGAEIAAGFTDRRTVGYLENAPDGTLVYDAEDADPESFTRHVIDGPILDCSLGPWSYNKFIPSSLGGRRMIIDLLTPDLKGRPTFYSMSLRVLNMEWNAYDYVGVGIFECLLRKVNGIRMGRVRRGEVMCRGGKGLHVRADAAWVEWEE